MASASEVEASVPNEPRVLSNAELTRELNLMKRLNTEIHNQVQNLIARVANLDRTIRAAGPHRR